MNLLIQHTGKRGRPAARIAVQGVPVGVTAARLYALLEADTSARAASNGILAERAGVRAETVARALGALEAAGLVFRRYDRLGRVVELPEAQQ